MWNKQRIVFLIFSVFFISTRLAANGAGNIDDYLRAGVGARYLGMGRTGLAFQQNSLAVYWNPASLAGLNAYEATFAYSGFYETNFFFASGVVPTQWWGNFGWGALSLMTSGVKAYDEQNIYLGSIDNQQSVFFLSYGNSSYGSPLSLGATLKVVYHKIDGYSDEGFGFDGGIKYSLLDGNLALAVVWQNFLGPSIKLYENKETFPAAMKTGASYRWRDFLFASDIFWASRQNPKISVGSEYTGFSPFLIRVGINETDASFGFGQSFKNFSFNYALSFHKAWETNLGFFHRFDITYTFSEPVVKFKAKADKAVLKVMKRARKHYRRGELLYAIDRIWEVFEYDRNNFDAAELLEIIQKDLRDALAKNKFELPEDISYARGVLAYATKSYVSALNELKQVISINPQHAEASHTVKKLEEEITKLKQAEEARKKALEIEELLTNGIYLYSIEKFEDALIKFEKVLELDPKNETAQKYLELCKEEIKKRQAPPPPKPKPKPKPKPEPVKKEPEIVYERNPEKAEALYNDGLVEYSLGRIKQAINYWEMALKYDPENKKILRAIKNAKKRL